MSAASCCSSIRTLQFKVNSLSQLILPFHGKRINFTSNGVVRKGCQRVFMFLKTAPKVKDGVLSFNGTDVLVDVPDNVVMTPWTDSSAFMGSVSSERSSRNIFKLGIIEDSRFLSLFRFKIWWMIPRFGKSVREIPAETQFLLLEKREPKSSDEEGKAYVLFLPVLDGDFRSSLQGNSADELEVCVESGDPNTIASEHLKAVFVNYGNNPFDLIKDSMKILQKYMGTFELRENKQMPEMLDCFGWCTWDAFYHQVNPQGIKDGLQSLHEGGTPAKFLIIDDGWQDTVNEFQKEGEPFVEGSQFGARLVSIRENRKFRNSEKNERSSDEPRDLQEFLADIKQTYGLKFVYVWHALMGYWGGLHPNAEGTKKYGPELKFPIQSPGNHTHKRDLAMDAMEEYGVGIFDSEKAFEFYDDLHSYLSSQGVDGVKVDVQNILETLSFDLGGRVSLTRGFQKALEESIAKNFRDNGIICCMAQNTDSVYSSKRSAITRASDDYYPNNPTTQTLHIASVAYNSLFFGEIVVPDWDMFYSQHESAEFHAVARAIGGCGVYVSDMPGKHDFDILKRLVLPDGSVLRAKYHGRPSRDCLFNDPTTDRKSLLKIWNVNKTAGVIAVFNCQGAGNCPCLEDEEFAETKSVELSGYVSPSDVGCLQELAPTEDFALYSFKLGSIHRLAKHEKLRVTLTTLQCDVFTVSPIKVYDRTVEFAPLGLIDMYNSGGAVDEVEEADDGFCGVFVRGRGEGSFGAYSSVKPRTCYVNMEEAIGFEFDADRRLLTVDVPRGTATWEIVICY